MTTPAEELEAEPIEPVESDNPLSDIAALITPQAEVPKPAQPAVNEDELPDPDTEELSAEPENP